MPAVTKDFDALHPQRWSNPPPADSDPIIPCQEPEDEQSHPLLAPSRARPAVAATEAEPFVFVPMRRVMPASERRLLERAALGATVTLFVVAALVAVVVLFQ